MQKFGFLEREKNLTIIFLYAVNDEWSPRVMSHESIVITFNLTNRRQFSMVCTLIDVLKTRVTAF